jgi:PHD/YefM family antitoxin component YafN of YafNO toxin-antitoxin module
MTTITLQDIKTRGAKAISDEEAVYLIVNSKTKSVLVPPELYEMLMDALEELEDIKAIEERKNEQTVPFTSLHSMRKKK